VVIVFTSCSNNFFNTKFWSFLTHFQQFLWCILCQLKLGSYFPNSKCTYLYSSECFGFHMLLIFNCFYPIICSCFTTEILEGFDVQRTNSLRDTLKKYAHLTQSITQYYSLPLPEDQSKSTRVCPPFDEFIKRCQDLEKMTVSDVFAIQLMQVLNFLVRAALGII